MSFPNYLFQLENIRRIVTEDVSESIFGHYELFFKKISDENFEYFGTLMSFLVPIFPIFQTLTMFRNPIMFAEFATGSGRRKLSKRRKNSYVKEVAN